MEYKRITYEIIETYPNILRHKIPLIQILMAIVYFSIYPFILIFLLYKKGLSLFSKIEFSKGPESNDLVYYFDLDTLESTEFEKGDVLNTESIYYSFDESILIGEELEEKGFSILENVGRKYRIKKREETCFTTEEDSSDEIKVILSVPRIAIAIHGIFETLKLT